MLTRKPVDDVRSSPPGWMMDVLTYMIDHFADDITLDDLANAIGVSKFNFCRQFHRYQGMPPLKWLWRFRAILARELLKLPLDWDIKDVAYACGFSSCAHFSRIFRESFGDTPTRYRNTLRLMNCPGPLLSIGSILDERTSFVISNAVSQTLANASL